MSRLGLKSKGRFNITITSASSSINYQIVSSPTSKYFALFGYEKIYIFHAESKNLASEINYKAKCLLFDLQDKHIIVSDSSQIRKYSISNNESKIVLPDEKKLNNISSFAYSPNYRNIFISNNSQMISMNAFSLKIDNNLIKQQNSCSIDYIYVNSKAEQLISSSFDCNLCLFSINQSNHLTFITKSKVQQCRIRQLLSIGDTIALTKNTITSVTPQILLLNPKNLALMGSTIQNSTQMLINLVKVNNYILSFAVNDNIISIYKDNLRNVPQQIYFDINIINAISNQQKNEVYIFTFDQNKASINLQTFSLSFNCSFIKNQSNSISLDQYCQCEKGKLFSRSQIACKTTNCQSNQCKCPYQQKFNSFSLQCLRDCSQIFDSFQVAPYGIDNSCACFQPFAWNKQISDCSFIDCSYINNTVKTLQFNSNCRCIDNYEWSDANLTCVWSQKSISEESSNSNALGIVLGVLFLVLLLAISGVIYYYKKYKKSPEDYPKTYQYPQRSTQRNFQTPRPIQSEVVLRDGYFNSQIPMYTLKSNRKD